jgi:hypothetical protein
VTPCTPAIWKQAFGARLVWLVQTLDLCDLVSHLRLALILDARLAIEHPSCLTIIDSVKCVRLTLIAPEPTLLQLGLQSSHTGSHSLQRTGIRYSPQLYGEFFVG